MGVEPTNWNTIATGLIGLVGTVFASYFALKMARISEDSKQARGHTLETKTTTDKILVEVNHSGTIRDARLKEYEAQVLRLSEENKTLSEWKRGQEMNAAIEKAKS